MALKKEKTILQNKGEEEFVELLTKIQTNLLAFIRSLVMDFSLAQDLVQETNKVLWQKKDTFTLGTNFTAWALKTAQLQVLAYYKKNKKWQTHHFDEHLVEQLGEKKDSFYSEQRMRALEECLEQLPEQTRFLLQARYAGKISLNKLSQKVNKTVAATKMFLMRARQFLAECIDQRAECK